MTLCNGDGECLIQCSCVCIKEVCICGHRDHDNDECFPDYCSCECYKEVCICGHRDHNGYCPSNCCTLIECRNYKYCNIKLPQWVLWCSNDMCINCDIQMGPHETTNELEDCCVCLEHKIMIILKCNHRICNDCWYKISKEGFGNDERKNLCPLCRNINDWSK